MMGPELWSRIRRSRLVGVLLVYLGASWLLVQVANELRAALSLPTWVSPVTVLLLLVGLLVVLATAWVQSHPATPARAAREEVPGSWELDLGELAGSLRKGRLPHLTWTRAILGGVFAFSLLFGFAGLYVLIRDSGRSLAPEPLVAGEAAPGIAVLPFDVRGPDADVWREGMVDVLSKALDGAAGLRTIDSRTVLARWREGVPGGATPDAATAVEVARRAGARYAILGSVVAAQPRLRAVADVYDLKTGERLGEAQAEGPADSTFTVVDRFAGEILRSIVGERGEIPRLDVARATTASLPALKAYLEGEAHLRAGRFELAAGAFQRAVAADSTFALAWLRLSDAYGWSPQPAFDLSDQAAARAARLADRLPERDALLVRGAPGILRGSPESLEALRTATRKHPEDPLAWHLLGDFIVHQGGALLIDPEEGWRALQRAIELDPSFSPAYLHAIHLALRAERDSARVGELIERYARLAPGSANAREFRLAQALAFGTDSIRERALAGLDTLSGISLVLLANMNLSHPGVLGLRAAVLEAGRDSPHPFDRVYGASALATTRFQRGELEAALEAVEHPRVGSAEGAQILYLARVSGLPVPEERLERALAGSPGEHADAGAAFVRGAWALERGRSGEHERARLALREMAQAALAAADTIAARQAEGAARALEGLAAWRDRRREEAERALHEARLLTAGGPRSSRPNRIVRWWLAELALESGRLARAAELFLSLAHGELYRADPLSVLRLARVQEKLGRLEEARANYEWFALAWRDADPGVRHLLEEARQGATRLAGLQRP